MKNNAAKQLYTAYLVTNSDGTYLNRRVYSGRVRGVWSPIEDSFIFRSVASAQSCVSNINRRSRSGREYARITPVLLERSAPTRG